MACLLHKDEEQTRRPQGSTCPRRLPRARVVIGVDPELAEI